MAGETIAVIGAIATASTPLLIGIVTFLGKYQFGKLDRKINDHKKRNQTEHGIISDQLYNIASNYSAEKKIVKIASEAEQFIDPDDKEMMVFVKACVDVSIHFYNQLSSRGLRFCSEEDIERASNGAIGFIVTAKESFEEEFSELFWEDFIDNAVDVRKEFLEIFQDEFNRKEDRFIMAIERYLFNQLKMVIIRRNKYNGK